MCIMGEVSIKSSFELKTNYVSKEGQVVKLEK